MIPSSFPALKSVGGLLPRALLRNVFHLSHEIPKCTKETYGISSEERINEVIEQSWNRLYLRWKRFQEDHSWKAGRF